MSIESVSTDTLPRHSSTSRGRRWVACFRRPFSSVHMNLAGTGLYADQRSPAIKIAFDVMAIERALHQHFVIRDNSTRARGPIKGQRRITRPDVDIARAGL